MEELEKKTGQRREKAAMNCVGNRSFAGISTLSPIKLNKESKAAGIQKLEGISRNEEARIKTARMPIPPPFGVGVACELRSLGLSNSPSLRL